MDVDSALEIRVEEEGSIRKDPVGGDSTDVDLEESSQCAQERAWKPRNLLPPGTCP
jgi:hypothetical protein